MAVRISRPLLERIISLARAEPEREVCGLLLGDPEDISDIQIASNVADDPARNFEIEPATLLRAHREARMGGLSIIGHYHSHPGGSSTPSSADAAEALEDDVLWLIVGIDDARLWRSGAGGLHGRFTPEQLVAGRH
ncbi:MAG: M67 family metallopeptidase [Sphingobium sp.]|uniref:M67 family metallopeptidase n=1 Tax=Sphingobium sp. TaxID=1912891 RepID=UPI0029BADB17|nr:M67 family metallopeptidase [Sphingobium sp.]MDX3910024.1 M67 family metallopeptidase [Sphingobium sp.]